MRFFQIPGDLAGITNAQGGRRDLVSQQGRIREMFLLSLLRALGLWYEQKNAVRVLRNNWYPSTI